MSMGGGGKGGQGQKGTTYNTSLVSPQIRDFFENFKGWSQSTGDYLRELGPYTGEFIAKPDPRQKESLGWMESLARKRRAEGLGSNVVQYGNDLVAGKYLNPESNPYLQDYLDMGTDELTRAWSTGVVPRIRSSATAVGADLGTREGLVETESSRNLGDKINEFTTGALFDTYGKERALQSLGVSQIEQGLDLENRPADELFGVGETYRGFKQERLNNEIMQFQELVNAALRPGAAYQPFAAWAPAFADSQVKFKNEPLEDDNDWMQYVQLALSLVSLAGY